MSDTPDDLSIIRPKRHRETPPASEPLSCYLVPDFWRGAAVARQAPEVVVTRLVGEEEIDVGRRTIKREVVERAPFQPSEDEKARSDEMLNAIGRLGRATAAKRDIRNTAAYHRWLGQGTKPADPTAEDEES